MSFPNSVSKLQPVIFFSHACFFNQYRGLPAVSRFMKNGDNLYNYYRPTTYKGARLLIVIV